MRYGHIPTTDSTYGRLAAVPTKWRHAPFNSHNQEIRTDPKNIEGQTKFFIQTIPDKTNSTITIDNYGIGMIKNELVDKQGKIAKVGMEAMSKGGDFCMIEQFGVGFYVAHLVSDKARVVSKNNDDE